ncbi:lamin tail domain-containing protein [Puniceicoccaceae bacterium K14]|nr:lamin tail domain-containing protein [Puniceicoccaceae bacterium K14]
MLYSKFDALRTLDLVWKGVLCFLCLTACSWLQAAEIVWETPQDITGTLVDFDVEGELVEAWNGGGSFLTIGSGSLDIPFEPGPDLANGGFDNADPQNRNEDQDYETLLGTMTWASSNESLSFTGLTSGGFYRVQLWIADTRTRSSHRQKTYDSGEGTQSVVLDSGPPSQFVIGNFVADGSTQEIRFVGTSGATHPQYNALMLREIGPPVPDIEELSITFGAIKSDKGVLIFSGESARLTWTVTNSDSVVLQPGSIALSESGTRDLSPSETQTYRLVATNSDGVEERTFTIYVDEQEEPLVLNEIQSSNDRGVTDEDGDEEDWIELRNPNSFALSLGGYELSDDEDLVETWSLPNSAIIPAGGYLLVFASEKDRTGDELHTNFKLSSDGEYLALLKEEVVVSQLPENHPEESVFPAIKTDFSYGVNSDGLLRFFANPTPGEENSEGYLGFVEEVEFSVERGIYENSQSVSLSCETEGAQIRYTQDGTFPSLSNGILYSAPIDVDETMVVRAVAVLNEYADSEISSHTYIIPSDVIASDVMDTSITESNEYGPLMEDGLLSLPSLSLSIPELDSVDNSTEQLTSVEFLPNDGEEGFQVDAGVSHFGGYFTDFDKKSFRLYFRKDYGPGKLGYPLFDGFENGMPVVDEFDALDLRSGSHDMEMRGAYLSNRFTDDSMLEMGHFNPHGRFVHLYINGVYWGQYHLRERWAAAMAAEYFGGDKDDYEAINGNANNGNDTPGGWSPGVAYDGDGSSWEYIKSLAEGSTPWEDLPARVDLDAYIDYVLLYATGSCENEYRNISQPVDGGVGLQIYLNDADGYLRSINGSRADNPGPGNIMGALMSQAHPEFMMYLADRIQMHYFQGGALSPNRMVARLQKHIDATELSFLAESARWGYRTPESWRSYQDNLLENDLPSRAGTMISAYRSAGLYPSIDAPSMNQFGGNVDAGFELKITNPLGGTTYFTINGEDPRLTGGAVNSKATALVEDATGNVLVSKGSDWRYLDDGSNQGTAWRGSFFNDSSWSVGTAELGYGDGDENTTVSYGSNSNNKHITTYFRKTIEVENVSSLSGLTLELMRDDGAVVYINGVEIMRSNMPGGTVTSSTLASSAASGGGESTFIAVELDASMLDEGNNVIAVEVHQSSVTSSDVSFDLKLSGQSESDVEPAYIVGEGSTIVQARTLRDGEWSALRSVVFSTAKETTGPVAGDLVVTEIHYHPLDPTEDELLDAPDLDDGDFEFLELLNVSSKQLILDGVAFTTGVEFVFPIDSRMQPGERIVLCRNLETFPLRYSESPFGEYGGALSNSGETLVLVDAEGNVLLDLNYGDSSVGGWPIEADGDGRSLVLIDAFEGSDQNDPASWSASVSIHGSPGIGDGAESNLYVDEDGDGFPRILEALLLSSDKDAADLPQVEQFVAEHEDGNDYLYLSFVRSLSINANLLVQGSRDLIDWNAQGVEVSRTQNVDDRESLMYRIPLELRNETDTVFVRIMVVEE